MLPTNEALLGAWLRLSTSINNSRLVTELPYNESLICNVLYRNDLLHNEKKLTATELCAETKILKSQMNRSLQCDSPQLRSQYFIHTVFAVP